MKILISLAILVVMFSSCQKTPKQAIFPWKPYSQKALEDSIAQHKPVVIDFSADWCPVCHELDNTVLSRSEIQAKLSKVTALRMDATDQDDPNVQSIIQHYSIYGLPTIVFLNSQGIEIISSRIEGLVTPGEFAQALASQDLLK